MPLPQFQPIPLGRIREPFSHPDWIFELKWDGFRALLFSDENGVRLVFRNGNVFKSFPGLCDGLARDLRGRRCVLDGEIVCLDSQGKPRFMDLLFRRAEPVFYAFDLLWDQHAWSDDEQERRRFRNGEDTRYLPLGDRKLRLRAVVPKRGERLLYCDHIDGDGEGLFRLACGHDHEGIVAKRKSDPYLPEHASWLKFGIRATPNGLVERSCSNGSANHILTSTAGTLALGQPQWVRNAAQGCSIKTPFETTSTVPTWTCPHSGHVHTPATLQRLDSENVQCGVCGKPFAAVTKH